MAWVSSSVGSDQSGKIVYLRTGEGYLLLTAEGFRIIL